MNLTWPNTSMPLRREYRIDDFLSKQRAEVRAVMLMHFMIMIFSLNFSKVSNFDLAICGASVWMNVLAKCVALHIDGV